MPLASFWKWKLLELRNGLLNHPQSQSKWKSVWRLGTITLMAHRIPRTSKLRSDVLTAGFILEIGQWESNGPPSVILGGPFSKQSGTRKGAPNPNTLHECFLRLLTFYMGRTRRMLCRHFGTFWATEKASARIILQNPGCLSGEMMTQKKRRKAIATVRGYKSSK